MHYLKKVKSLFMALMMDVGKNTQNWLCGYQLFVLQSGALQLFSTNLMYMSIHFIRFRNCKFSVAAWEGPYTLFATATIANFLIGVPSERSPLSYCGLAIIQRNLFKGNWIGLLFGPHGWTAKQVGAVVRWSKGLQTLPYGYVLGIFAVGIEVRTFTWASCVRGTIEYAQNFP